MKKKIKATKRHPLVYKWWQPRPRSFRATLLIGFLVSVSLTSGIMLALPYLPHLSFLFHRPKIDAKPYQQAASKRQSDSPSSTTKSSQSELGNRLVLPSIGVNSQIIEGKNIYVIGKNQGVWHESRNIDPTTPGNIVIAGHRFLYTATNGGYFYNLPELKLSDKVYIKWNGFVYEYEVYNTRTVMPTQTDVRDNDPNIPYKLTMYTCYPLGSTAKRFVVEAKRSI